MYTHVVVALVSSTAVLCISNTQAEATTPCDSSPCINRGTCSVGANVTYTCECLPAYSGPQCENVLDPCSGAQCVNGATCSPGERYPDFICRCPPGFVGPFCEQVFNPCDSTPCMNSGNCSIGPNFTYTCPCQSEFEGTQCENVYSSCNSFPCLNNGSCYIGYNFPDFECDCHLGFDGDNCENVMDPCLDSLCMNGGTCIAADSYPDFVCHCPQGFEGPFCEHEYNPCDSTPCMNRGNCSIGTNFTYTCQCQPGFEGTQCENVYSSCNSFPCLNNGSCYIGYNFPAYECNCHIGFDGDNCENVMDPCVGSLCMNGGTCIAAESYPDFICHCPRSFVGTFCEQEYNPCDSTPCMNSGNCSIGTNFTYTCQCQPGFEGTQCENAYTACRSGPCLNDATCHAGDDFPQYDCECSRGFEGMNCENEKEFIVRKRMFSALMLSTGQRQAFDDELIGTDSNLLIPTQILEVKFGNINVSPGDKLTVAQTSQQPTCTWVFQPTTYYTLLMSDLDAPSRDTPIMREWNHWIVGNIEGLDMASGEVLTSYAGPTPPLLPSGTPYHRYFLALFDHGQAMIDYTAVQKITALSPPTVRGSHQASVFATTHNLGTPVAMNYFLVKNDLAPEPCDSTQFRCTDAKCIPMAWTCDMDRDCEGGTDEAPANAECTCARPVKKHATETNCNDGYKVNSLCSFTCEEGYVEASGTEETAECTAVGTDSVVLAWVPTTQDCILRQCAPPTQEQGTDLQQCTDGHRYMSVCTMRCDAGYELEAGGTNLAECIVDANREMAWKGPSPCVKQKCNVFEVAHGTSDCVDGFNLGSECHLKCDDGYRRPGEGTQTVTCVKAAGATNYVNMDGILAPCEKRACSSPDTGSSIEIFCTEQHQLGSQCFYECQSGKEATVATSVITCVFEAGDMAWKGTISPCQEQKCALTTPEGGQEKQCEDERRHGTTCSIACDAGFRLTGDGIVKCVDGGDRALDGVKWLGDVAVCTRVECQQPIQEFGQLVSCTDNYEYGSFCAFRCNDEYYYNTTVDDLSISQTVRCVVDESNIPMWDRVLPPCKEKRCVPAAQSHGHEIGCTEAYHVLGTACTFACDDGYELPAGGNDIAICVVHDTLSDAVMWDRDISACTPKFCTPPAGQDSRARRCSTDKYQLGTSCVFECSAGYRFAPGATTVTICSWENGNMAWKPVIDPCIPQICTEASQVKGKETVCDPASREIMSTCTFECDNGYTLPADSVGVTMCDVAGQSASDGVAWDMPLPVCMLRRCGKIKADVRHVHTETHEDYVGSVVTRTCAAGYGYEDSETAIVVTECTVAQDGTLTWSVMLSSCVLRHCEPAWQADGYQADCSNGETSYESICSFECNHGFELPAGGIANTKCVTTTMPDDGDVAMVWENELTACKRRACAEIAQENGHNESCTDAFLYGSTCTFVCNHGYYLPEGGLHQTMCMYVLQLHGIEMAWNTTLTGCRERNCSQSQQKNGHVVSCTDEYRYKTQCRFECDAGFQLPDGGTSMTVCGYRLDEKNVAIMEWDSALTDCQPRSCDALALVHSSENCTHNHLHESQCSVRCDPGYQYDNANISEVVLACDVKYQPDLGLEVMQWQGSLLECQVSQCHPLVVPNGDLGNCSRQFVLHSVCSFTCNIGYEVNMENATDVGNTTCLVMADGGIHWDVSAPLCTGSICPNMTASSNGYEHHCTADHAYQSECYFACNHGYAQDDGVYFDKIRCVLDPESGEVRWTRKPRECIRRTCPRTLPRNGLIRECTDGNRYESTCWFACNIGFYMKEGGVDVAKCVANSSVTVTDAFMEWNQTLDDCLRMQCPNISQDNGSVSWCDHGFHYQSICKFQCNEGFAPERQNHDVVRCKAVLQPQYDEQINGRYDLAWNCSLSPCAPYRCQPVLNTTGTLVNCTDDNIYLSRCSSTCVDGYRMPPGGATEAHCDVTRLEDLDVHAVRWNVTLTPCENLDECGSNPCQNDGQCVDGVNSFECVCTIWKEGTLCEIDVRRFNQPGKAEEQFSEFANEAEKDPVLNTVLTWVAASSTAVTAVGLWFAQVKFGILKNAAVYLKSLFAKII